MSQRQLPDFLEGYMAYTDQLESPDNYHTWTGLSMIAACLGRKIWMNLGHFRIFPNMYIVLVGPAGKCRKSVAINTGTDLLLDMSDDVKISADAITREALIRLIKDSEMSKFEIDGDPYVHSSVTIVSKELSVFIGTGNHDLIALLTDLYDAPKVWEYKTKNQGTDNIRGVWLNMLGASTPDWLIGSIPLTAIGGGFTSRIIFVVAHDVRKKTAIPELGVKELDLRGKLQHDLEAMCLVRGEYKFTTNARKFYIDWYETGNTKIDDPRFWGYAERKHIHMIKIALVLAASEDTANTVHTRHITRALDMLNDIEPTMVEAFGAAGRSHQAADIDEIMTNIRRAGTIEHKQLMKSLIMDVDRAAFNEAINTLLLLEMIKGTVQDNGTTWYIIPEVAK